MLSSCKSSSITLLIFIFITSSGVHADDDPRLNEAAKLTPNLKAGEQTYRLCAACHGINGFGLQDGEFPSIAGQHQGVILKQLLDIQSKKRINPTMYPFTDMKTLGGLQGMLNVAAYTATLDANPAPITGKGENLEKGQAVYRRHCTECHGQSARGRADLYYPRLSNQHYPYLVRELIWIRDKVRKNANPIMVDLLKDFSEEDIYAVSDYLSRIP